MSDEKNLKDGLDDMLGDAKEGVKKAADKASELADDAKESINDFTDDAKKTFNNVSSDGKNVALIAHITVIGLIIAFVMNNGNKTQIGSFYVRQSLGLSLVAIAAGWIPIIGWLIAIVMFVFWILSLIGALSGEEKLTPVLGEHFQNWFKSL
ncbi:YtxH domain-containing protein [Lacinutrix sp.]|uniref:YtxH domain-containing protein n=1 Tax=Lacinutrix sp. TaxID=1937692 RepID=UPI0025BF2F42|nr:YtxH domain-containing protein [Lacinutrix sp.]